MSYTTRPAGSPDFAWASASAQPHKPQYSMKRPIPLLVAFGEAHAALHVGELANIEVLALRLAPAEEDVGRTLGYALPNDDALALVGRRQGQVDTGRQDRLLGSLTWRNNGSSSSTPCSKSTQHAAPTLPTPTTLRAASTRR
jgi:hypothetical protein